jgi:predicted dehydrogenase
MTKVKFGILGCAEIAMKNAAAIVDSPKCDLVGLASRDEEKAKNFRTDCGLSEDVITYTYDDIIHEEWIDALYIPLPTALKVEWVVKACQAGKHCVIEKPAATDVTQLEIMLAAAKANNVLLMDGVMFVHSLRHEKLREMLNPMRFGQVERVQSSFSFRGNEDFFRGNIRASAMGDPLGCLGDLGWYCLRVILQAYRCNEPSGEAWQPVAVRATCHEWVADGEVPVDMSVSIAFDTQWKRRAEFSCSFTHSFHQDFIISAKSIRRNVNDHLIRCDDMCIPRDPASPSFQFETLGGAFEDLATRVMSRVETYASPPCKQEVEMFTFFATAIDELRLAGSLRHTEEKYERLQADMVLSQQLCDVIMESARGGGVEVNMP